MISITPEIKSTDYLQITCPAPVQIDTSQLVLGPGVLDLFYDLKNYGDCRSYCQDRIFEVASVLYKKNKQYKITTWQ